MDILDIRIFCEMFKYHTPYSVPNRRPHPAIIARRLDVDAKTVRARVRRMEEEGFIKYYQALPNYNALGVRYATYFFSFPDPAVKRKAIGKLKLVDEVTEIVELFNSLGVDLLYRTPTDLERKVTIIKELTGVEPMWTYDLIMPPVGLKFSLTDWLMIKSLRSDALKPSKRIAEEVGVTRRTVDNRLGRLMRAEAFYVAPVLGAERIANLIVYFLVFFLDEANRKKAIKELMKAFDDNSFSQIVNPTGAVVFLMFATNQGEPENNYIKASTIEGVNKVFMDFLKTYHDCSEHIDHLIEEKIKELRPGPKLTVGKNVEPIPKLD